jgi:hypothetical protein
MFLVSSGRPVSEIALSPPEAVSRSSENSRQESLWGSSYGPMTVHCGSENLSDEDLIPVHDERTNIESRQTAAIKLIFRNLFYPFSIPPITVIFISCLITRFERRTMPLYQ